MTLYFHKFRGKPAIPSLIGLSPLFTTHLSVLPHTRVRSSRSHDLSTWSWIVHLASGHIYMTQASFTRFHYVSFFRFKLAIYIYSLTHYAKGILSQLLLLQINFSVYFQVLFHRLSKASVPLSLTLLFSFGHMMFFRVRKWSSFIQILVPYNILLSTL